MMKKYILPLLVVLAMIAGACENEIEFNKAAHPSKLVMNALINSDSINNLLLLNMSGQTELGYVPRATVEVRVNGRLVETPEVLPVRTEESDNPQKRFLITTKFQPGDEVRIDAMTDDGMHHAWAEVTVPHPIAMDKVEIDTVNIKPDFQSSSLREALRYRITFRDRPNEKNYYRLSMERRSWMLNTIDWTDTLLYKVNTKMEPWDDVVLTDGQPGWQNSDDDLFERVKNIYGVFSDDRFKDGEYTMTVYTYFYDNWPYYQGSTYGRSLTLLIRLLSISETEYRYLKALNLIDSDVYDATMSEPIRFASNVNGGLGIVSISSESNLEKDLWPGY